MTDRIHSLTVVLEQNVRDDDIGPTIDAISMLRGVADVRPMVADSVSHMAEERARQAWRRMLFQLCRAADDGDKLKRLRGLLAEFDL